MASVDYYSDSTLHGNYQYVTLEELITDFLISRDPDDYTATIPRFRVLYQARRGLRELYYDVLNEISAIELDLSPSLTVVLPPDFVNYVRVSWVQVDEVTGEKKLYPMAVDSSMSMAKVYLQDNDYNLLFDANGCVLEDSTTGIDPTAVDTSELGVNSYTFCDNQFTPNIDLSKVFENGRVALDRNAGVLRFGSEVYGKSVVVEYISDGLFTGCEGRAEDEIRVHKFAESAMLDFIYYQLVKNRRNVPYNEKQRSRKEFYNSRRIAKRRINTLRKEDLLQTFKGASRWIK